MQEFPDDNKQEILGQKLLNNFQLKFFCGKTLKSISKTLQNYL